MTENFETLVAKATPGWMGISKPKDSDLKRLTPELCLVAISAQILVDNYYSPRTDDDYYDLDLALSKLHRAVKELSSG